jgi:hypothetical protein
MHSYCAFLKTPHMHWTHTRPPHIPFTPSCSALQELMATEGITNPYDLLTAEQRQQLPGLVRVEGRLAVPSSGVGTRSSSLQYGCRRAWWLMRDVCVYVGVRGHLLPLAPPSTPPFKTHKHTSRCLPWVPHPLTLPHPCTHPTPLHCRKL